MSGVGNDGKDMGADGASGDAKVQAAVDDLGKSAEPSLLTKVVEGTKSTIAGAADYVKKVVG